MNSAPEREICRVLLTEEQIAQKVRQIAADITRDYAGKKPFIISVLKGSFIFMADLVRHIDLHCTLDFLAVSSYGNKSTSSGAVKILKDLDGSIEGRDVIVVEDILDSGVTLSYIIGLMESKNPVSLRLCALLDKPSRRKKPVKADYVGFEIPDEFVVGYGLDYADRYRNLPFVGVLDPSVYT